MFTGGGRAEYEKWAQWVVDDEFDLSSNFIPDADTPRVLQIHARRAIHMLGDMVDFDSPDFSWPTGIGMSC